jgi:hypothetical protein
MQLGLGIVRRSSWRTFAGILSAIAASAAGLRETAFTAYAGAIPIHLVLLATLGVGLIFCDRFALVLRRCGAVALPLLGLVAGGWQGAANISPALRLGYILALTLATFGYWLLVRDRWYLVAGGISSASLAMVCVTSLQGAWMRSVGARGFQPLVWGGVFFVLAALISAMKGSRLRRRAVGSERPDGHGTS